MADGLLVRNIRITVDLSTPAQSIQNGGTQQANDLQQSLSSQKVVFEGTSTGEDLSIDVTVSKIAGQTWTMADVIVYGLGRDIINVLSHVNFYPMQILYNAITIEAGYDGQYNKVFEGHVLNAVPDYTDPNTPFMMQCQSAYMDAITQAPNYNPEGDVYVEDAIKAISAQSVTPLTVNANGISNLKMTHPMYTGGVREQLEAIARDNNLTLQIDDGVVYVSSPNQPLNAVSPVEISPDNVLLGYPMLYQGGVDLRVMYNAFLQFGQPITIKSSVPLTSGNWFIVGMIYALSTKHDKYEILLKCMRYGYLYNNG